jgi:hypothetical protein
VPHRESAAILQHQLLVEEFAELLMPTSRAWPYPEVNGVGTCTDGDLNQCILVTLEKEPPAWNPIIPDYKGMRVIWRIVGRIEAL